MPLQQFAVNASTDLPIELGEFGIDRASDPLPGGIDEMAHIIKQSVIGWYGVAHVKLSNRQSHAGADILP